MDVENTMDEKQQMHQQERQTRLESIGLSPGLHALATRRWPHRAFEFRCEEAYRYYSVSDQLWPKDFIALWEWLKRSTGVAQTPHGLEFLVWDLESDNPPVLLARSEQGLFYWRFSYLIEDEDWDDEEAGMARLRDAAASVSFRHFDRLNTFALLHERRSQRGDQRRRPR